LEDAVRVTKELNRQGIMATIDVLGEFIKTLDQAADYKNKWIEVLNTIQKENLNANVSIKPTQMGLNLDKNTAYSNLQQIIAHAKQLNNFVRIDMEDTSCTDSTLEFYRRLRTEFPGNVGVVLQSYLRRTPKDIDSLSDGYLNFRLCKGIYNEPRIHAYKDPYIINQNYIYCLENFFKKEHTLVSLPMMKNWYLRHSDSLKSIN